MPDVRRTPIAGRYEIGPVIGAGGMAEVRAGTDLRLERPVAIKIMRPEMSVQPGVRSRFEAEARLAARLAHPHVVAVYDSGEDDGVPFIVMERLPGDTLADRLRRGPMSVPEVHELALVVLGALDTAHRAGVLHRDIKPGNILASPTGWKVADFGIAKAVDPLAGASDITVTGLLLGTPAYVAPERFAGHPATVGSDLYSVGVVLYEAVTGHKPQPWPHPGSHPDGDSNDRSNSRSDNEPPGLPAGPLGDVITRAMDVDPTRRFASAAAMAAALMSDATLQGPAPTTPPAPDAAPTVPLSHWGPPATEVLPLSRRPGPGPRRPLGPEREPGRTPPLSREWALGRVQSLGRRRTQLALALAALVVIVLVAVSLDKGSSPNAPTTPSTAPAPAAGATTPDSASAGTTPAPAGASQNLPSGLRKALGDLQKQVQR